ncbi:hypothetical protein [Chthonobacter rhizosphaerae]|uniref:hypothetical protein n=1 Tax=Chthonobacter rhizosphaerae TaxID=2735553 RepID=UPI0015EF1EE0|nr:hypothetical protein [Chthonobacter rhizosphaerae]
MSRLPPRPRFESIEASARRTADRRTGILALVGNLVFAWSNNESLFIYALMVLARTDEAAAAIIFGTLNTTRARLDLVQRLAKARLRDPRLAAELDALIDAFNDATRLRNELIHSMYMVDEHGDITHTNSMKIQERRGEVRFGAVKPMSGERIEEIQAAILDLCRLNRTFWDLLPRLEAAMEAGETGTAPHPLPRPPPGG